MKSIWHHRGLCVEKRGPLPSKLRKGKGQGRSSLEKLPTKEWGSSQEAHETIKPGRNAISEVKKQNYGGMRGFH